jgi:hypothetical protein
MTRRDANEIVKALLAKYEPHLKNPPEGQRFQDCFNIDTLEPTPQHYDVYTNAKAELRQLGLPLRGG